MGGVHKKTETGSYPLDRYQVASLLGVKIDPLTEKVVSKGDEPAIHLPSEAELQDRSQSDWLAKLLVLFQSTRFVVQCIARTINHLPITELEIITLAYAVLNLAIYVAWWDKPNRVDCPILITANGIPEIKKENDVFLFGLVFAMLGYQLPDNSQLNQQTEVPMFYDGECQRQQNFLGFLTSFILGLVFGAIHCSAWHFVFTNITEQRLWRASCIVLTSTQLVGIIGVGSGRISEDRDNVWDQTLLWIGVIVAVGTPLIFIAYLMARVATIYIAIHSLHFLPPETFLDIQWTHLIPHI